MKALIKQFGGILGAGIAAACCLGIPVILSALGAAGLGFLTHDAYLFPIFAGFVGLSLWLLFRSARQHTNLAPFWLAVAGALLSGVGLFLLVTGIHAAPWTIYAGLGELVARSAWGAIPARRQAGALACEKPAAMPRKPISRRVVTGAAPSVAAAGAFYCLYKVVAARAPEAKAGDIASWGINSCKGTTACTTAYNACTGPNDCKGQGYL